MGLLDMTFDSYEEFRDYVQYANTDDMVGILHNIEDNEENYDYADTTTYIIRYVTEHMPEKIANSNAADIHAAEGKKSLPLINPYWGGDCRQLFRLGFWPVSEYDYNEYSVLLYLTLTDAELQQLGHITVDDVIIFLQHRIFWIYTPVGILRDEGVLNCKGFQLGLQAPDLVYPSGRPITDMALFRNTNSNRVPISDIKDGKWMEWSVIPVTRYANGMSGALFYKTQGDYCGTFYYNEPNSTTFLAYKRAFRSFNKSTAMAALSKKCPHTLRQEFVTNAAIPIDSNDRELLAHANGELPRDLILEMNGIKFYGGAIEYGLYAAEDKFDQPLCKLAAKLGYDIVILEAMVGSFQIVTEVLDVRSRKDSFLSLVFTY